MSENRDIPTRWQGDIMVALDELIASVRGY